MEPEILSSLSERFLKAHTALLIIDMQNDFCVEGFGADLAGRDLTAAKRAIPGIERLLNAARSAGVLVAHVGLRTLPRHGSDSGPWLAQRRRATFSSEALCIADTEGAQFIDKLRPTGQELVVHKHRYSAFTGTSLDMLLRGRQIRSLIITGVSTNACVESTLRAAFELDYYVGVPPQAVASWDETLHHATLANVNHRFGVTPTVEEIVAIWNAQRING